MKTKFLRMLEFVVGFNFFGKVLGLEMGKPVKNALYFLGRHQAVIELDDVRQFDQRQQLLFEDKIIQGNPVTELLEIGAGGQYLRGGRHVFQNFDNNLVLGKRSGHLFDQKVLGKVDEAGLVARDFFDTFGEKSGGEQAGRGPVAAEFSQVQPKRLAEEQFVGKQLLVGIENRLPGNVDKHGCETLRVKVLPEVYVKKKERPRNYRLLAKTRSRMSKPSGVTGSAWCSSVTSAGGRNRP